MSERIFVYGTLRRGFPHHMAERLAAEATHEGRATWNGRLFDCGDHPAALPPGEPQDAVLGDLYRVEPATLAWLDLYEELDAPPRTPWFRRVRTQVQVAGAGRVPCWIYRFDEVPGGAERVSDGDYLRHRAAATV